MSEHDTASSPRLTVCMIARDEEGSIGGAIQSVSAVAGEVIVLDTGSTDGTARIAEEAGAKVYRHDWRDDFSAARNDCIEKAAGDWILCLDADERLTPGQEGTFRLALHAPVDALFVTIRSPLGGARAGQVYSHRFQRLFRNRPEIRFDGRVHEQVHPSLERAGLITRDSEITLDHAGYSVGETRSRRKLRRNLRLLLRDLRDDPDNALARFHAADTYDLLGRSDRARDYYRNALATGMLGPSHELFARQNLAAALLKLGDAEKAAGEAALALRTYPDAAHCHLISASAKTRGGDHEDAIADVNKALEIWKRQVGKPLLMGFEPEFARAYRIRGESRRRLGHLVEAEEDGRRVTKHSPTWAGGYRLLALIALEQKKAEAAERYLRKVFELEPTSIGAIGELARLYAATGRPEKSLAVIIRGREQLPRSGRLLRWEGALRVRMGDLEGALPVLRQLVEINPNDSQSHKTIAGICHKLGKSEEAGRHLLRSKQSEDELKSCPRTNPAKGKTHVRA